MTQLNPIFYSHSSNNWIEGATFKFSFTTCMVIFCVWVCWCARIPVTAPCGHLGFVRLKEFKGKNNVISASKQFSAELRIILWMWGVTKNRRDLSMGSIKSYKNKHSHHFPIFCMGRRWGRPKYRKASNVYYLTFTFSNGWCCGGSTHNI